MTARRFLLLALMGALLTLGFGCDEKKAESGKEHKAESGETESGEGGEEPGAEPPAPEGEAGASDESAPEAAGDAAPEPAPEAGSGEAAAGDPPAEAVGDAAPTDGDPGTAAPVPEGHVLPADSAPRNDGDIARTERVIRMTTNYLKSHASKNGAPADQAGALQALVESAGKKEWPNDPWGNPYIYTKIDDTSFEVSSAGPDGEGGNDDDIRVTE